MLSFIEFITSLGEDATPSNATGSGIDNYDPVMALRKMQRRETWFQRKESSQRAKAKIAESIAQYQQIKEELYGAH
jgi:hypothetical protein